MTIRIAYSMDDERGQRFFAVVARLWWAHPSRAGSFKPAELRAWMDHVDSISPSVETKRWAHIHRAGRTVWGRPHMN